MTGIVRVSLVFKQEGQPRFTGRNVTGGIISPVTTKLPRSWRKTSTPNVRAVILDQAKETPLLT